MCFQPDYLVLDIILGCSNLEKDISPGLSIPYLAVVLCVNFTSLVLFSVPINMSIGVSLVPIILGSLVPLFVCNY